MPMKILITPEQIRPSPKAAQRKEAQRGRKRGRSRILTSTLEKAEAERLALERERKKSGKLSVAIRNISNKKQVCEDSESSSEELQTPYQDTDDNLEIYLSSEKDEIEKIDWNNSSVNLKTEILWLLNFVLKSLLFIMLTKCCSVIH
ncbi:unnamed protein product [Diabrotica balteata]|uniref:Uncharacterized protein n=1 Tax=Diabrotica balteata TaxID=107213 RepID=A0A9N9SSS3_DIABA|nr:unnamed protein product [Diabrotica balteata]